jgi:hypothetical protein
MKIFKFLNAEWTSHLKFSPVSPLGEIQNEQTALLLAFLSPPSFFTTFHVYAFLPVAMLAYTSLSCFLRKSKIENRKSKIENRKSKIQIAAKNGWN